MGCGESIEHKEQKEEQLREGAKKSKLAKVKELLDDGVNADAADAVRAARPHFAHKR